MFHFHISYMRRNSKSTSSEKADYILREGRYSARGDRVRRIGWKYMPEWAKSDPREYWRALDRQTNVRANARLMFCIEAAIPRDLPDDLQNQLVDDFVTHIAQVSSGRDGEQGMPALYAIHEGIRRDDAATGRKPNPHLHFLISTSINDGRKRPPEIWFGRANGAKPERSGAPRSTFIGTRKWLLQLRQSWSSFANAALRQAGLPATLDHRSHRARGLVALPTVHLGPARHALLRMGQLDARVQYNARVRAENEKHEEALEALRKGSAHSAAWRRQSEAEEQRLQQELLAANEDLRSMLASHPLADPDARLISSASVLVLSRKMARAADGGGAGGVLAFVPAVRAALGTGWLSSNLRGQVWWTRADCDNAVLMGPGYLATDGQMPGLGYALVNVAAALGLDDLTVYVADPQGDLKHEIAAALAQHGLDCTWRLRKPTFEAKTRPAA